MKEQDQEEARAQLIKTSAAFKQREHDLDEARAEVIEAIIEARKVNLTPGEVEKLAPFGPAYVRRIIRDAGLPPARHGGGAAGSIYRNHPGIASNEITLYASRDYSGELLEALESAGLNVGRKQEFAAAPVWDPLLVVITDPAVLVTIGVVLRAFFKRHKDKKVELTLSDGTKTQIKGYSAADVERILEKTRETSARLAEEHKRLGNR